jgi:hypothetical protein
VTRSLPPQRRRRAGYAYATFPITRASSAGRSHSGLASSIYFTLGAAGKQPKLFGGIPLDQLERDASAWDGQIEAVRFRGNARNGASGLGPEHSQYGRLELSVTAIARALPMD